MTAGCALLALLPRALGVAGYVVPIVVITAGYALFQTADNTAVMSSAKTAGVSSRACSTCRVVWDC